MAHPVPLTVIGGFLRARKTTLVISTQAMAVDDLRVRL